MQTIDVYQPQPHLPLEFGVDYRFALRVVSTQGDVFEIIQVDESDDVMANSLRWSVDGNELAFIGYESKRNTPPCIHNLNPTDRSVHYFESGQLDPTPLVRDDPQLLWSSAGELLVYASKTDRRVKPDPQIRRDWWVLERNGSKRCLTAKMPTPPVELITETGSQSFVGLADGNLWRIRLDGAAPENLTSTFEPKLTALVFPEESRFGDTQVTSKVGAEFSAIIVSSQDEELTEFYWIDLASNQLTQLPKPTSNARIAGYNPQGETTLFFASDRTGTYLWTAHRLASTFHPVVETNTFLQEIASGEFRLIDYQSLDGETLKAALILPPDYQPERTYPLVAWVYPGRVVTSLPNRLYEISHSHPFNLQLLAAHGYVVLEPSIPLKPEGEVDDPMLCLTNGVLPAVEQAIALGIADPKRLFVMGQSFGGYAIYGLITQTHRFHAAVAIAGLCNLISLYGLFDARQRYDDFAHEDLFAAAQLESAQIRMGSPPWKDLGRYLRNSPIFAIDRVQTPLMIIQGDMDYVPIQQGEEFFRGLHRQGKRAAFVRYWGEGHVLTSPANIRDMWQRILNWFEEFSRTD